MTRAVEIMWQRECALAHAELLRLQKAVRDVADRLDAGRVGPGDASSELRAALESGGDGGD